MLLPGRGRGATGGVTTAPPSSTPPTTRGCGRSRSTPSDPVSNVDHWGTWWGMLDLTRTLSIADVSVDEGDVGPTALTFTVTLSEPTTETVSVEWATADDTAKTTDGDYVGVSNTTRHLRSGRQGEDGDGRGQRRHHRTRATRLSSSTSRTPPAPPSPTPRPRARSSTTTRCPRSRSGTSRWPRATETSWHGTAFVFPVTLSNPSSQSVQASWGTLTGTAVPGATLAEDYVSNTGSITFLPGEVTLNIVVQVHADEVPEADETFSVVLSLPSGGTLLKGQGMGTILNDDATNPGVEGLAVASDGPPTFASGRNRLQWKNPSGGNPTGIRITWEESGSLLRHLSERLRHRHRADGRPHVRRPGGPALGPHRTDAGHLLLLHGLDQPLRGLLGGEVGHGATVQRRRRAPGGSTSPGPPRSRRRRWGSTECSPPPTTTSCTPWSGARVAGPGHPAGTRSAWARRPSSGRPSFPSAASPEPTSRPRTGGFTRWTRRPGSRSGRCCCRRRRRRARPRASSRPGAESATTSWWARAAASNNLIYALDPFTGAVIDTFPQAGDGVADLGAVNGMRHRRLRRRGRLLHELGYGRIPGDGLVPQARPVQRRPEPQVEEGEGGARLPSGTSPAARCCGATASTWGTTRAGCGPSTTTAGTPAYYYDTSDAGAHRLRLSGPGQHRPLLLQRRRRTGASSTTSPPSPRNGRVPSGSAGRTRRRSCSGRARSTSTPASRTLPPRETAGCCRSTSASSIRTLTLKYRRPRDRTRWSSGPRRSTSATISSTSAAKRVSCTLCRCRSRRD